MRRRAPKCAGIRGYVGVHLGVHFQEVGVHWVLYPHATSHPAAPALRMPAAAPKHRPGRRDTPQQRQQWHTRNKLPLQTEDAGTTAQDMAARLGRTLQQSPKGDSRAPITQCSRCSNGANGCILRHSHTSNHAAYQRQILRGMTIFTGDTGDKL